MARHKPFTISARRSWYRPLPPRPPQDQAHGDVSAAAQYPPAQLSCLVYGPEGYQEYALDSVDQALGLMGQWPVVWVQVQGLGSEAFMTQVGEVFNLHPLVLEEIAHPGQRPKAEIYEEGVFLLTRTMRLKEGRLCAGQLSLWAGGGLLISFEEEASNLLEPLKTRLRYGRGRIRQMGTDYLAYAIVDTVVEGYFPLLETLLDRLTSLEDDIIHEHAESRVEEIHALKRDLLEMRQGVWPLREAVNNLLQEDDAAQNSPTRLFLRDCQDHLHQITEMLEVCRELNSDLMALHLSHTANQQGEVVRVLTIISTIFIPLSFVASVYGMNFHTDKSAWNMPELNWPFGYPLVLGLMATFAGAQMAFFYSKGWIGPRGHLFKPRDEGRRFRRTLLTGGRAVEEEKG